jgi:hypothetical protein
MGKVPEALRNKLGIAMAQRMSQAYGALLGALPWQRPVK